MNTSIRDREHVSDVTEQTLQAGFVSVCIGAVIYCLALLL